MKLLKDLRRNIDTYMLYISIGLDDFLYKTEEFIHKKVLKIAQKVQKKCQKVGKSGAKCRKCTCSTEKNKKKS